MMDTLWQTIKDRLKNEVPENQYRMWIEPLDQVQSNDRELLLGCPNSFFLKWIKEKYFALIVQMAQELDKNGPEIGLQVSAIQRVAASPLEPRQFTLPGFDRKDRLRLNGGFTFDQFVTGPSNHFAYLASMALATDKNLHNNALYLFSTTGLGKTHLSQAVGNYIIRHKPQAKVLYLSTEDFTNEMVFSLKNNSMNSFKDKYRKNCDFLLLEGVQFLSGKETTQSELGFTLDALFNDDKKIIFTSSLPPKDIPRLGNQLKSRLSSALIGSIDPPDFETRLGIVEKKSKFLGIDLKGEVKEFLASKPFRDMRQLEGCLVSMSAQATLLNQMLDLSLAELVVREQFQEKQEISIQAIKDVVGKYFRVSPEEMTSRSRKRVHLLPRNLSIFLSKKYTNQTLETIGKAFNRDSTSVIYAVNSVEKGLKKNTEIGKQVQFLSAQLEGIQNGPSATTH
ncbi:MAG: chromosomal replication initiator protein DnaA [Deltaproteobacteria bacterium]|nr:chromosomal replication initiator protein DnaA [Deltaproteobacteria bacterium]